MLWHLKCVLVILFLTTALLLFHIMMKRSPPIDKPFWNAPSSDFCECNRLRNNLSEFASAYESTCSLSATLRGKGQLIVSYSLYGLKNSSYYEYLEEDIEEVSQMYPGWLVRIYTNMSMNNFCTLLCKYVQVDICDVTNLPSGIGNVENRFGMIWRFLVLGDPLVDRFLCRDLDSAILQREVDAVSEWVAMGTMWHVMRDHPEHRTYMPGGMWGVANSWNLSLTTLLRQDLLENANKSYKGFDQALLTFVVWPHAKLNLTTHDSYLCTLIEGTIPFPSVRVNGTFVGAPRGMTVTQECPHQCRPPTHTDWIYC